eukprot:COSAG02_NODE_2737_length_8129_cov_8.051308_4_plen_58_part_00
MRVGFLSGNDWLFAWGRFLIFIICRIRIREMKWQPFGIGLPFVDHFRPISGLSWNIL